MSRILIIQNSCFWNKKGYKKQKAAKKASFSHSVSFGKEKSRPFGENKRIYPGVTILGFVLAALIFLVGALYLYQVNSIATKGYELKEVENKIQESEKEINKLKIKEVELKSMYNIEKSTEDMDLVVSSDVSYLDMPGPVAMK